MILAREWTFLSVIWAMLLFSLFLLWIGTVFYCFIDNFKRKDHGGGKKVLWAIFIIFLPFLGVFSYILARPRVDY